MIDQTPAVETPAGNRATRRATARRGRKLAALGSGAVLATGAASAALAAFPASASAVTIAVSNTNDAGAGSLRQALADANPGDTIDLSGVSGTITLTSGQLDIDDAVTITGPGASTLAISGNGASRVFQMDSDLGGGTVTITGVTITGGNTTGQGAGINFYCDSGSGNLVIDSVVITGNTDEDLGAGLYFDRCHNGSNLTIANSVISNNTATDSGGGGIWFDEGETLTIQNTTVANNRGAYYGGGLYFDDGANLVVLNSTFSGNQASQGGDAEGSGGAIQITDLTGSALIANSTISGNSAIDNGGGINLESGSLTLEQATISGNTAGAGGDGLYLGYGSSSDAAAQRAQRGKQATTDAAEGPSAQAVGTVAIAGTIIAGNADGTDDVGGAPDGGNAATVTSSVTGGVNNVTVTDGGGNQTGVTDPGLAALAANGGPTETMALLAGSAAIDAGPNPVPDFPGNEFDQRGPGFARVVGSAVDVGAYEVQEPAPAPLVITPRFTG
jgi:hypothetical protein